MNLTTTRIEYEDPFTYYKNNAATPGMLLESRSLNLVYGRQSLVMQGAALKVSGSKDMFTLQALDETWL